MNIEKGMYVRTDTGNILKYENEMKEFIDEHISLRNGKDIEFLGTIVNKPSHKIIDAIRIGDLINNQIITNINYLEDERLSLTTVTGNFIRNNDIKSILTKEQISAHSVKLEV